MKRIIGIALVAVGATACGEQSSKYHMTPVPDRPCVIVEHYETNGWTTSERDFGESNLTGKYCKEGDGQ